MFISGICGVKLMISLKRKCTHHKRDRVYAEMQRIKQISIRKYIMTGILVIILTLALILLVFINILAEKAITADIQTGMTDEIRQNGRYVLYEDGQIKISKEFMAGEDGMYFVVLGRTGTVYAGSYPPGLEREVSQEAQSNKNVIVSGELTTFQFDGETYYLLDRVARGLQGKRDRRYTSDVS